jgi:hypothetical protein
MLILPDSRVSSKLGMHNLPAIGFHMGYQYLWTTDAVIF